MPRSRHPSPLDEFHKRIGPQFLQAQATRPHGLGQLASHPESDVAFLGVHNERSCPEGAQSRGGHLWVGPAVVLPSVSRTSRGRRSLSRSPSLISTSAAFSMPVARGVRPPVGSSSRRGAASTTLDVGGRSILAPSPRKEIKATLSRRW